MTLSLHPKKKKHYQIALFYHKIQTIIQEINHYIFQSFVIALNTMQFHHMIFCYFYRNDVVGL
jgi:hypothetical protein